MTYLVLENLKADYKDGFRCIHSEIQNDAYIMQLKNFTTEQIKMLSTANPYEISKIKHYLDCMDRVKDESGHDC